MSRSIEIVTGSNELKRGQLNRAVVRIHFESETTVRGIHARFRGAERTEAEYTETYTDSKGKSKTRTRTAVQHVEFASEEFLLFGEPIPGFFQTLGDGFAAMVGSGDHPVMPPGTVDYPVEFFVPKDAPPSFTGRKCSVFYQLEVRIDIPMWPDPTQDHRFQILNVPGYSSSDPVLVRYPDTEKGRGFWDKTFGKDVTADVALDRDVFVAGETFSGMLHMVPGESIRLNGLVVSLNGIETSRADGHDDSYTHVYEFPVVETPATISKPFTREFKFTAPDVAVYTSTGNNYQVEWKLAVRLDVPWALDPTVELPIEYYGANHVVK